VERSRLSGSRVEREGCECSIRCSYKVHSPTFHCCIPPRRKHDLVATTSISPDVVPDLGRKAQERRVCVELDTVGSMSNPGIMIYSHKVKLTQESGEQVSSQGSADRFCSASSGSCGAVRLTSAESSASRLFLSQSAPPGRTPAWVCEGPWLYGAAYCLCRRGNDFCVEEERARDGGGV
jgi:hypothetical protein